MKSLPLSKPAHMFTVLPKPNKNWIKNLEKLFFYNFIWNNKTEIISRRTMQLSKEKGWFKNDKY
jgi:hypothetical protein